MSWRNSMKDIDLEEGEIPSEEDVPGGLPLDDLSSSDSEDSVILLGAPRKPQPELVILDSDDEKSERSMEVGGEELELLHLRRTILEGMLTRETVLRSSTTALLPRAREASDENYEVTQMSLSSEESRSPPNVNNCGNSRADDNSADVTSTSGISGHLELDRIPFSQNSTSVVSFSSMQASSSSQMFMNTFVPLPLQLIPLSPHRSHANVEVPGSNYMSHSELQHSHLDYRFHDSHIQIGSNVPAVQPFLNNNVSPVFPRLLPTNLSHSYQNFPYSVQNSGPTEEIFLGQGDQDYRLPPNNPISTFPRISPIVRDVDMRNLPLFHSPSSTCMTFEPSNISISRVISPVRTNQMSPSSTTPYSPTPDYSLMSPSLSLPQPMLFPENHIQVQLTTLRQIPLPSSDPFDTVLLIANDSEIETNKTVPDMVSEVLPKEPSITTSQIHMRKCPPAPIIRLSRPRTPPPAPIVTIEPISKEKTTGVIKRAPPGVKRKIQNRTNDKKREHVKVVSKAPRVTSIRRNSVHERDAEKRNCSKEPLPRRTIQRRRSSLLLPRSRSRSPLSLCRKSSPSIDINRISSPTTTSRRPRTSSPKSLRLRNSSNDEGKTESRLSSSSRPLQSPPQQLDPAIVRLLPSTAQSKLRRPSSEPRLLKPAPVTLYPKPETPNDDEEELRAKLLIQVSKTRLATAPTVPVVVYQEKRELIPKDMPIGCEQITTSAHPTRCVVRCVPNNRYSGLTTTQTLLQRPPITRFPLPLLQRTITNTLPLAQQKPIFVDTYRMRYSKLNGPKPPAQKPIQPIIINIRNNDTSSDEDMPIRSITLARESKSAPKSPIPAEFTASVNKFMEKAKESAAKRLRESHENNNFQLPPGMKEMPQSQQAEYVRLKEKLREKQAQADAAPPKQKSSEVMRIGGSSPKKSPEKKEITKSPLAIHREENSKTESVILPNDKICDILTVPTSIVENSSTKERLSSPINTHHLPYIHFPVSQVGPNSSNPNEDVISDKELLFSSYTEKSQSTQREDEPDKLTETSPAFSSVLSEGSSSISDKESVIAALTLSEDSDSGSAQIRNSLDSSPAPSLVDSTSEIEEFQISQSENSTTDADEEEASVEIEIESETVGLCSEAIGGSRESQRKELLLRERLLKATLRRKVEVSELQISLKNAEKQLLGKRSECVPRLESLVQKLERLSAERSTQKRLHETLLTYRNEVMKLERRLLTVSKSVGQLEEEVQVEATDAADMQTECLKLTESCIEFGGKLNGIRYRLPHTQLQDYSRNVAEVRKYLTELNLSTVPDVLLLEESKALPPPSETTESPCRTPKRSIGLTKYFNEDSDYDDDNGSEGPDAKSLFSQEYLFRDILGKMSEEKTQLYEPYLTPLSQTIIGGMNRHKSVTLSEQMIDPLITMCLEELKDGKCKNFGCSFQHIPNAS